MDNITIDKANENVKSNKRIEKDKLGKVAIDKYMLYINIDKKKERELRNIIKENDKNAFIVENETNLVVNGYFK